MPCKIKTVDWIVGFETIATGVRVTQRNSSHRWDGAKIRWTVVTGKRPDVWSSGMLIKRLLVRLCVCVCVFVFLNNFSVRVDATRRTGSPSSWALFTVLNPLEHPVQLDIWLPLTSARWGQEVQGRGPVSCKTHTLWCSPSTCWSHKQTDAAAAPRISGHITLGHGKSNVGVC